LQKIKEEFELANDDFVTVTKMGHITEIQYMAKRTPKGCCPILKLDANHYVLKSTGEIKEYNKAENRSQSAASLRKTMKKLRYKINNNFFGERNELFLTLTYKENMTDTTRLYRDCDVFIKRLKRFFGGFEVKYLTVIEPQQRGAWHAHILLKLPQFKGYLYVPNDKILELWEHGFTKTKKINSQNVDNIGAYLTAYLTDIEVPLDAQNGEIKEVLESGEKVSKKFIKGGRLNLYPSGMNFYRCSRNCKSPDRILMRYSTIKNNLLGQKVFESSFSLIDTKITSENGKYNKFYGGQLLNTFKFEVYNDLRKTA